MVKQAEYTKLDETYREKKTGEYILTLVPHYPNAIAQAEIVRIVGISKQGVSQYVRSLERSGKVRVFKKGRDNYVTLKEVYVE